MQCREAPRAAAAERSRRQPSPKARGRPPRRPSSSQGRGPPSSPAVHASHPSRVGLRGGGLGLVADGAAAPALAAEGREDGAAGAFERDGGSEVGAVLEGTRRARSGAARVLPRSGGHDGLQLLDAKQRLHCDGAEVDAASTTVGLTLLAGPPGMEMAGLFMAYRRTVFGATTPMLRRSGGSGESASSREASGC